MTVDIISKEGRQKCWDARDKYWKCLDDNLGVSTKCIAERQEFEKDCSKTWVKYFDRRKDYLKFKSDLETGKNDLIKDFINKNKKPDDK